MTQLITNGIKIAVHTAFNGAVYKDTNLFYAFSYSISIENKTNNAVQLLERYWKIYDALHTVQIVTGKGVVGKTPVIAPTTTYTYTSNCFLIGQSGAMKGFFNMINLQNNQPFQVIIPAFQLNTFPLLN